jgi:urease accessory protein
LRGLIGRSSIDPSGDDLPAHEFDEETRMKLLSRRTMRGAAAAAMATAAGLAHAHTGHGAAGLFEGLAHPLALDHMLAAAAVGFWSVAALPHRKAWWGPAAFLLALVAGAILGVAGFGLPFLEQGIALSVALFGAMLVLACRTGAVNAGFGLAMVAAGAALHGMAHGAEAPAVGFASYAAGFLVTTAALHLGGVVTGLAVRRFGSVRARTMIASIGGLLGGAGLYLFTQI